jgi:hypothetical protein
MLIRRNRIHPDVSPASFAESTFLEAHVVKTTPDPAFVATGPPGEPRQTLNLPAINFTGLTPPYSNLTLVFTAGREVARVEKHPIPTVSQWGLIGFGMFLLTAMALALWRRRAA